MIESISIKNIASYDNSGVQINDLKKVNFIYGANGSGKTTISNFLANQNNPQYQNCGIAWQHSQHLQCLVYNKKFKENNFGKGTIEGIFTLGQATKEDIELIEQKQTELRKLQEEGIEKKKTLDKQKELKEQLENSFKEDSWSKVYKKYEHDFKEAFKRTMQKETFKNKLLIEFDNNVSSLLSFDELKEKSKIIFGRIPETIAYQKSISFNRLLKIENEEIWAKKILGKSDVDIAALIQKLNINDWVNQGRGYLKDDNICPFCQQSTITDEFKNKLEGYFDESFTTSIKQINALNEEYNLLAVNIINELTQIEANEKSNKTTKLNIDTFSAYVKTLLGQFVANKELLNNKIKEPSRVIKLISLETQLKNIEQLILEANNEIKNTMTL